MMKRICPIMALSNSNSINKPAWCIEERCAWCRTIDRYPAPEQYVCAILEIAARLQQLNGETLL